MRTTDQIQNATSQAALSPRQRAGVRGNQTPGLAVRPREARTGQDDSSAKSRFGFRISDLGFPLVFGFRLSGFAASASWLLLAALLSGCAGPTKAPTRYAWITGLKPEKAAYYRDLHAHPWPAVNKMIKDCHIQKFSIYEREIEGKLYLFAYLEYTGQDFDADMKKMAADPETVRWWAETDPCQSPLPDAAAKQKIWADLKEVYFLK